MSPSGASVVEDESNPMYLSLKGRVRRPSAKVLEKEVVYTPAVVTVQPSVQHVVSLQIGVAEVMIDEEGHVMDSGRSFPETIETVLSSDWKLHGRTEKPKSGRPRKKVIAVPKEEMLVEPMPVAEPVQEEEHKEENKEEEIMSDSESAKITSPFDGQGKRKRGRPFKGQEKPVEERLLIETSKIRRLIDDILRKSGDHSTHTTDFCLKLRNVARDIDDAMIHFPTPSPSFGPEIGLLPGTLAHLELHSTAEHIKEDVKEETPITEQSNNVQDHQHEDIPIVEEESPIIDEEPTNEIVE